MDKHRKKQLKAQAHHLKPVVIIGAGGYSEGVQAEIEHALDDHELIKIRISEDDRDARAEVAQAIVARHKAEFIGSIGHIVIIYRKRKDEK